MHNICLNKPTGATPMPHSPITIAKKKPSGPGPHTRGGTAYPVRPRAASASVLTCGCRRVAYICMPVSHACCMCMPPTRICRYHMHAPCTRDGRAVAYMHAQLCVARSPAEGARSIAASARPCSCMPVHGDPDMIMRTCGRAYMHT